MKAYFTVRIRYVVRGLLAFAFFVPGALFALTYTISAPIVDTYVDSTDPTTGFGSKGAMQLTGAGNEKGQMSALLRFDVGAAIADFNSSFGTGQWTVTSAVLSLGSNFGTQGVQPNNVTFATINAGEFEVTWLYHDDWADSVTYSTVSNYLNSNDTSLGVFDFNAPGDNTVSTYNLVSASSFIVDLETSGIVSLYLSATTGSEVSYLFNSSSYGTVELRPQLILTASAIPEPATVGLVMAAAVLSLVVYRKFNES